MRRLLALLLFLPALVYSAPTASVGLVWEHEMGPDIVGYNVYQSEGPGDWRLVQSTGPVLETRAGDLLPGVSYRWYVTAFNSVGESGPSNEVSLDVPTGGSPTPVKGLTAIRDATGLQVSWTDAEIGQIVLAYQVEYLVGGSTEWLRVSTQAKAVTLPVPAREYVSIRVRKLTPVATGAWAEVRVPGFPKAPTKLTVTPNSLLWTIPP